jgi:hypothetical protein
MGKSVEEVDNRMWNEIYQQFVDIIVRFFDKGVLLLSLIFGAFLSIIGYPKQVIVFIVALTLIDIITKHISEVIFNYKLLNWHNYIKAWQDRILTSRQLKNGICVKVILYSCILYIANQLGIIPEILFGSEISGILYSLLCFVEISSILENAIHSGRTELIPLYNFFKNKQKEVIGDKIEDISK